jgi:hypothetical protein
MRIFIFAIAALAGAAMLAPAPAAAHGGGLNAQGCHNERRTGGYHCHRAGSSPRARAPRRGGRSYRRSRRR